MSGTRIPDSDPFLFDWTLQKSDMTLSISAGAQAAYGLVLPPAGANYDVLFSQAAETAAEQPPLGVNIIAPDEVLAATRLLAPGITVQTIEGKKGFMYYARPEYAGVIMNFWVTKDTPPEVQVKHFGSKSTADEKARLRQILSNEHGFRRVIAEQTNQYLGFTAYLALQRHANLDDPETSEERMLEMAHQLRAERVVLALAPLLRS